VKYGENDDVLAINGEVDGVRKATEKSTTDLVRDALVLRWACRYSVVRDLKFVQELLPETRELPFVPIERRLDVGVSVRSAYKPRHSYRLRSRRRSMTSYTGFAVSGACRWAARRASARAIWLVGTGTSSGRAEIRSHSSWR